MSDQIIAALITGAAGIVAALIGVWRWREHGARAARRALVTGEDPPIFASARSFARSTSLEEQTTTIHLIELGVSHGSISLTPRQMELCAGSEWELDRIGLYLFEERSGQLDPEARVLHVRHEFERITAALPPRSRLPLLYALRSLLVLCQQQPALAARCGESCELLADIGEWLRKQPHLDPDLELRRVLDKLRGLCVGPVPRRDR